MGSDEEKEFFNKLLADIERDEKVLDDLEKRLNELSEEAERLEQSLDDPERVIQLKAEMARLRTECEHFKQRRKERYH